MHDLPSQTKNLVDCLTSKVRSDNPQLRRPTIEVKFDLMDAKNYDGDLTLHLIARDWSTKSYIYLAELESESSEWVGKGSEFYSRIYVFVRHILRLSEEESIGLSPSENGRLLVETATREFQMLIRR